MADHEDVNSPMAQHPASSNQLCCGCPFPRETVELLHLIMLMAIASLSSAIFSTSQTLLKPVVGYLGKKGKAKKMMICGGGGGGSSLTPTGSTTITAFTVHVLPVLLLLCTITSHCSEIGNCCFLQHN